MRVCSDPRSSGGLEQQPAEWMLVAGIALGIGVGTVALSGVGGIVEIVLCLLMLHHPELPLTNNATERTLRHWVITRQFNHDTRTETGSRVVALLASVIDTCSQREQSPGGAISRSPSPTAPSPPCCNKGNFSITGGS